MTNHPHRPHASSPRKVVRCHPSLCSPRRSSPSLPSACASCARTNSRAAIVAVTATAVAHSAGRRPAFGQRPANRTPNRRVEQGTGTKTGTGTGADPTAAGRPLDVSRVSRTVRCPAPWRRLSQHASQINHRRHPPGSCSATTARLTDRIDRDGARRRATGARFASPALLQKPRRNQRRLASGNAWRAPSRARANARERLAAALLRVAAAQSARGRACRSRRSRRRLDTAYAHRRHAGGPTLRTARPRGRGRCSRDARRQGLCARSGRSAEPRGGDGVRRARRRVRARTDRHLRITSTTRSPPPGARVPSEKLTCGLAVYGYDWVNREAGRSDLSFVDGPTRRGQRSAQSSRAGTPPAIPRFYYSDDEGHS